MDLFLSFHLRSFNFPLLSVTLNSVILSFSLCFLSSLPALNTLPFFVSKFRLDQFYNFLTSVDLTPMIYKISSGILERDDICALFFIVEVRKVIYAH